jgi:hypothetical protein
VLFGFDSGQVLNEHTTAVPVLLQVLDGHLTVTADERGVDLVPRGVIHSVPGFLTPWRRWYPAGCCSPCWTIATRGGARGDHGVDGAGMISIGQDRASGLARSGV